MAKSKPHTKEDEAQLEVTLQRAGCSVARQQFGLWNIRKGQGFVSWWPFSAKRMAQDHSTGLWVSKAELAQVLAMVGGEMCPSLRPAAVQDDPPGETEPVGATAGQKALASGKITPAQHADANAVLRIAALEGRADSEYERINAMEPLLSALHVRIVALEARMGELETWQHAQCSASAATGGIVLCHFEGNPADIQPWWKEGFEKWKADPTRYMALPAGKEGEPHDES